MNWKRELRKIAYKYRIYIHNDTWEIPNPNSLRDSDKVKFCLVSILNRNEAHGKLFEKIVNENNITYSTLVDYFGVDVFDIHEWNKLCKYSNQYSDRKVYIERRDNKSYYNYSNGSPGGSSGNYIRYPSKKRSVRVWRNFYKLFPWVAVRDGWDGNKSSRYP